MIEVQIVYEDEDLLVVNKPAGLIVHPKNLTDDQKSLSSWVDENYPKLKEVGEPFIASGSPLPRYGIVHRLDKDTSGLIVIAKNQPAFDYSKNLFQTHQITKHYYALVHGQPKEKSGTINAPLGRIGLKRTTRTQGKKLIDSKESITEYKVIKNYPLLTNHYSLLDVSPKTGRTHQIRVHLKSIGCPVVGDFVYGPKYSKDSQPPRLFLHAYKLEFTTPSGKALTIEADMPPELQNFINMLE